jgi:hypothetical protein
MSVFDLASWASEAKKYADAEGKADRGRLAIFLPIGVEVLEDRVTRKDAIAAVTSLYHDRSESERARKVGLAKTTIGQSVTKASKIAEAMRTSDVFDAKVRGNVSTLGFASAYTEATAILKDAKPATDDERKADAIKALRSSFDKVLKVGVSPESAAQVLGDLLAKVEDEDVRIWLLGMLAERDHLVVVTEAYIKRRDAKASKAA